MKMPNPNPHTRCTKLAARAKDINMHIVVMSIARVNKRIYAATLHRGWVAAYIYLVDNAFVLKSLSSAL